MLVFPEDLSAPGVPCYGIIPARYASTRFPGKPLALIQGMPMFWRVYQRARACPLFTDVILATDDERINDEAKRLDVPVVMTDAAHPSGTDRVCEAATTLGLPDEAIIVNIQGDEPTLAPEMLSELLAAFADASVKVATLARPAAPDEDIHSPDRVKVVLAQNRDALYFSRATIPYAAANEAGQYATPLLHVGLYAFRLPTLRWFTSLSPSPLERTEKLEQLRLLENGMPIRVVRTRHRSHGVDRPEDIAVVSEFVLENNLCKPY